MRLLTRMSQDTLRRVCCCRRTILNPVEFARNGSEGYKCTTSGDQTGVAGEGTWLGDICHPTPRTSAVSNHSFSFAILNQAIEHGCYRCHRIFVPRQKTRHLLLEVIADVAGIHRAARFHQDHTTSFSKPRLAAVAL